MNVIHSLDIHKMIEFRFSRAQHSIRGFVQAYTFVKYRVVSWSGVWVCVCV